MKCLTGPKYYYREVANALQDAGRDRYKIEHYRQALNDSFISLAQLFPKALTYRIQILVRDRVFALNDIDGENYRNIRFDASTPVKPSDYQFSRISYVEYASDASVFLDGFRDLLDLRPNEDSFFAGTGQVNSYAYLDENPNIMYLFNLSRDYNAV